jgi:DMSO/TMAO reductase YedYZ molybdopterin-dependent catalytic subunit
VAGRRTNLALLVLLGAAVATGVLMFGLGTGWNRWATVLHGVAGLAIVGLAPWKSAIGRRSVRRRGWDESLPALGLAVSVVVALATGFLHRFGVREMGPVDGIQLHVAAAAVAVALGVHHVVVRPVRPRRTDLSRRAALRVGAVAAVAAGAWVVLPTARRRFTGSLERGTDDPDAMPTTQWFNDTVPVVDGRGWRLSVAGREFTLAELDAGGGEAELRATLDCTGGWFAHQTWRGARLDALLGDAPGETVVVRSLTGYTRRFPRADAAAMLVATRVGGRPLSPGHGYPARLVVPGRRGFWWVKWLDSIELDDRPWWVQSPFPLT